MKKILLIFISLLLSFSIISCRGDKAPITPDSLFNRVILTLFVSSDSVDKDGYLISADGVSPQISVNSSSEIHSKFTVVIYDRSDSDRVYMYVPEINARDIPEGALNKYFKQIEARKEGDEHSYRLEVYAVSNAPSGSPVKLGKKCKYEKVLKSLDERSNNILGYGYIEFKK